MTPREPHLNEEQLAALVEGGLSGAEAREAERHLARCRACMAAYADAVHLRAGWRRNGALAAGSVVDARARFRTRGSTWVLAAGLALAIAVGAWLIVPGPDSAPDADFARVSVAVAAASHEGMLLPGAAGAAWDPPQTVYRSGEGDADLAAALAKLRERPANALAADQRALRIAGELAAGNLHMADILLDREAPSETDDPEILLLAGILAYRENDLAASERLLARVLALDPDHPEARFDLALVLVATGRPDRARPLLAELAAREDLPLLGHRARALLASLDS